MTDKKELMKNYLIDWRKNNSNKIKINNSLYYQKNKTLLNEKNRIRRTMNKEKYKIIEKQYREKNKTKIALKNKEWYTKNKDTYNAKRREQFKNTKPQWATYAHRKEYLKNWQKQKRAKDLLYRLNSNISRRIRKDLHRFNLTKKESTQDILPYTMQELKEHIEKQFTPEMNWSNMGETWEIDHSTPCAWASNEKDLLSLWDLKNLRPLLKTENREKQDSFSGNVNNTLSSIGR